jgi:hypothetical protein
MGILSIIPSIAYIFAGFLYVGLLNFILFMVLLIIWGFAISLIGRIAKRGMLRTAKIKIAKRSISRIAKIKILIIGSVLVAFTVPSLVYIYGNNLRIDYLPYFVHLAVLLMVWPVGIYLIRGYGRIAAGNTSYDAATKIWTIGFFLNIVDFIMVLSVLNNTGWPWYGFALAATPSFVGVVFAAFALMKLRNIL